MSPTSLAPDRDALSARSTPVRLSSREIEVLRLIADGRSSQEAADMLMVSKRTVDFHLAKLYDKLGVSNRLMAVREALRLGMLPFNR